jgi:hypothetical protein
MLHRIELALGQRIFETDRSTVSWSRDVDLEVDSRLFAREEHMFRRRHGRAAGAYDLSLAMSALRFVSTLSATGNDYASRARFRRVARSRPFSNAAPR